MVDDVPENSQRLNEVLKDIFQVKTVADGKKALILLDVVMPGMDGYKVCRRLKADKHYSDILGLLTFEDGFCSTLSLFYTKQPDCGVVVLHK
ncbi:MAG: hypothetical protein LPH21_12195 [Shewanella sp.]|nr:hypothetical protein [Shewanella sp.]